MKQVQVAGALCVFVTLGALSACLDFEDAVIKCEQNGRCAPEDAGPADGDELDGGAPEDDAGGQDASVEDAGFDCDAGFHLAGPVCKGAWCWEHPLPHGNNLTAIDGDRDTVWLGGLASMLIRIDGCVVRQVPLPESVWIEDLRVEPDGSVLVSGADFFQRLTPDGTWTPVHVFDGGATVTAMARTADGTTLAATSSDRIAYVEPNGTVVEHSYGLGGLERAVATAESFWVIDQAGAIHSHVYGGQDPAPHLPLPAEPVRFRALWASPGNEVFAVGDDGAFFKADGGQDLVRQAPNTAFKAGSSNASLRTITGADENRMWVAGLGGAGFELDGGTWTRSLRTATATANVTNFDYQDSWTSPDGEPWLVAQGGVIVTRRDGEWIDLRNRIAPVTSFRINSIAVRADERWACGDEGRILHYVAGRGWAAEKIPGSRPIRAAAALDAGVVLLAGEDSLFGEYAQGQFLAKAFTTLDGGTSGAEAFDVLEFARAPGGSVLWALGRRLNGPMLLRHDGSEWIEIEVPAGTSWSAIAAESDARVLLGSTTGSLGWVDVATPSSGAVALQSPPSNPAINDIAVTSAGTFIAGTGYILRVQDWESGTTMSVQSKITSVTLYDSAVTPAGVVYVGAGGRMFTLTPETNVATEEPRITNWELRAVEAAPDGSAFAVGANGVVIRRAP